jgi:hypothetical protein
MPDKQSKLTRLVVASATVETLDEPDFAFPDVEKAKKKELEKVRHSRSRTTSITASPTSLPFSVSSKTIGNSAASAMVRSMRELGV